MTSEHHHSVLVPTANQTPPSGWQPGFISCFQLLVRNTGDVPAAVSHADYAFLINGTATGVTGTIPCPLSIAPTSSNAREHNPVFLPEDLVQQAAGKKIALQITVYAASGTSSFSGSCSMPVVIADLPEPLQRRAGEKTALELMPSRFGGITNLAGMLDFLDRIYNAMADFTGQQPLDGECMVLREAPPFFAWAYAGFPILLNTTHVRAAIRAFDRGTVCFGWLHEMGHNFEYGYWYMYNSPACEFHANFKLAFALEQLITSQSNQFHLLDWTKNPDPEKKYASGREWLDTAFHPGASDYLNDPDRKWESMNSNDLLIFYLGLVRKHGWEPFKRMYRTYRALSAATADRPSLNAAHDMFHLQMAILAHILDIDPGGYCAEWRIPLSLSTMQRLADRFSLSEYIPSPVDTSH